MQTILSDFDRRVVGNLSIPRSLADLTSELRQDANLVDNEGIRFIPTEADVKAVLDEAVAAGMVTNLGEGRAHSPGELAALVDRHKEAVSMPDEKARIFERRMSESHRAWRLQGDVYHFTSGGYEQLHVPISPAPVLSYDQMARAVQLHVRASVEPPFEGSIHDADGGKLLSPPKGYSLAKGARVENQTVATLLPEELDDWLKQVNEYAEKVYGRKLPPFIAGGQPGWGDADEILIVAAENGGTAYGVTAPWFAALTTVAVTDADTGSTITEPTGATGYARKSVAFADMGTGSGSVSNVNAIVFAGITGGSAQTVIGFCKASASSAGRNIKYGTTASTVISTTQTPPQFAVGALVTSAD